MRAGPCVPHLHTRRGEVQVIEAKTLSRQEQRERRHRRVRSKVGHKSLCVCCCSPGLWCPVWVGSA